jgi:hypothetical protein
MQNVAHVAIYLSYIIGGNELLISLQRITADNEGESIGIPLILYKLVSINLSHERIDLSARIIAVSEISETKQNSNMIGNR